MNTTINLDDLLKDDNKGKQPQEQEEAPAVKINWNEVFTEWCYKIPKGYPTIVDGVFTEYEEVKILNVILKEKFGESIPLPERKPTGKQLREVNYTQEPPIKNKTTLKEAMVCLFYDACKSSILDNQIDALQKIALTSHTKKATKPVKKDIEAVVTALRAIFTLNKNRYGSNKASADSEEQGGSMPPDTLPDWIGWAYTTANKDAITTINNSLSAARAIRKEIGDGIILRNELFDDIRSHAVKLAVDKGIKNLKPDNWCPGDVYILKSLDTAEAAANAISLNISLPSQPSLNSYFTNQLVPNKIVACSLKEADAQAGKATEFLQKVFSAAYDSKIDPNKVKTNISAKEIGKVASAVKRYKEYSPSYPDRSSKRPKSDYNAFVKGGKIVPDINTILKANGEAPIKTNDLKKIEDKAGFRKNNLRAIQQVEAAIKKVEKLVSPTAVMDGLRPVFIKARNSFIKYISDLDVAIKTTNSRQLYDEIQNTKDPVNVITKKSQAYDLANAIMTKWVTKDMGNKAYTKILKLTNPFAALTAFAVAETGINPGFWKYIGSAKEPIGHGHWFDPKAEVDIVVKDGVDMKLSDSETFAGFELEYQTSIGGDVYNTTLSFRFSDSTIRIEVSQLTK